MSIKVSVITGAFGSLGTAVASAFAARGARLVLLDCAAAPPEICSRYGTGHLILEGVDLAAPDAAREAMQAARDRFSGIDVLVNIAGGFRWQLMETGDLATWDTMFSINLKTAVSTCMAALPHLLARGGGRIVNVGAAAAAKAAVGMGAYTASKSGVLRLTESLSDELKDRGITVNAVLPGTIDTPQNRTDMSNADASRWVAPADIASVILFLTTDAARAVTGASIPVLGRG